MFFRRVALVISINLYLCPMYKKHEVSKLKQEFWTSFGKYMAPVPSAEREYINWINYKTGEKFLYFRKDADRRDAIVAIECQHPDLQIRKQHFQLLGQFRELLETHAGESWIWEDKHTTADGKEFSRIFTSISGVSVLNTADWPTLISFFKKNSIAFDAFWAEVKYAFEALR